LSSRGTKPSRLSGAGKQSKERLPRCARNDKNIMSSRGTKRSRFSRAGKQSKERLPRCARLYPSSRGTKRSRLSGAGKQSKERLPRCARNDINIMSSRGTKRSRLCHEDNKKKDCRAALATPKGGFDSNIVSSPIPVRLLSELFHGRGAPLAFLTIKFAGDCLVMRIQLPKSNRGSNSNISSQRGVRRHCCCANSPQNGG